MIDWKEKMIEIAYGGDAQAFEKEYQASIREGNKHAISWKDLALTSTTLPHLEKVAHDLIEERLGYLPHISKTIEFEPFVRALIQSHMHGQLSDEEFSSQLDEQIKLIRNEEMEYHTFADYEPEMYKNYSDQLVAYGKMVRDRLTYFLGYEPELRYSIAVELWMQEILSKDTYMLPEILTAVDIKAIALIKYREVLLECGKDAADKSELWNRERIEK